MKNSKKNIKPVSRSRRFWRGVGDVIFFLVLGVFVTFSVWNAIDRFSRYEAPIFGYRTSVIVSQSMANAHPNNTYLTEDMYRIEKFAAVTTHTCTYDEIQVYDVITWYSSESDALICHRVVDKYESDGTQFLVTRGDANSSDDTPIAFSLVRGKVVNVIPKIGIVIGFFQSWYLAIAVFGSLFFIFLGLSIANYNKEKKDKQLAEAKAKRLQQGNTRCIKTKNGSYYENAITSDPMSNTHVIEFIDSTERRSYEIDENGNIHKRKS